MPARCRREQLRQVAIEQISTGYIHRDAQGHSVGKPDAALPRSRLDDPAGDVLDHAGLLGERNEFRRREHAPFWMVPAHQRFHAYHLTAAQIQLRLVVQQQLVLGDCPPQIAEQ